MGKSNTTVNIWRSRPIFVSSTFKDMHAERDHLRNHVFPRLEEELRKRRHQIEPIDLRLGVEVIDLKSEEAREALVLKVCLSEIQRSRPFLLVLLGDRYGWVPPEDRMFAAAQEAGFKTDVRGKSVTALEIEFGLKETPGQRRRSFFYIRDPLPYEKMPHDMAATFSDAYSSDPKIRSGYDHLQALKAQLRANPELLPRVHTYHVEWNSAAQRVAGLEAWGEMVFQHLWKELDDETRAFASQPLPTWEQQERAAFVEFVEQRRRDFTGREELLGQLHALATAPANEGASWGACVIGAPGLGKSALLAELYQRICADKSVLILANAAGATPRGSQVDSMLRRFIQELAEALKIANPLTENASPDDVDAAFASLLARTAMKQRVVVLLDALDQFDVSPRAQYITWLRPKVWPANARIIAAALPGTPAESFSQWAGVEELDVPPLNQADVAAIAKGVWARYHRQVNPEVLRVLSEKKLSDGQPAAGNPLWLTLALEQLNLMDADDFARADREFTGGPAERLRAMLVDTARRMPPEVPALYDWLLAQTEKIFGAPQARAFAALLALGRFGWRETDLLPPKKTEWPSLMSIASRLLFPDSLAENLDDLRLAGLRRSFRAHLTRRGTAGQLDFFHIQMRQAVKARALGNAEQVKAIHRAIADHLETLPEDDSLRETELMVHLIEGDDAARAARVYADAPEHSNGLDVPIPSNGLIGATQALARHILSRVNMKPNPHAIWVAALLSQPELSNSQITRLGDRFNFNLEKAVVNSDLPTRQLLLEAAQKVLARLIASDPTNVLWQHNLFVSLQKLGKLAIENGDLAGAIRYITESKTILTGLALSNPANLMFHIEIMSMLGTMGDLHLAQGDLAGALWCFTECNLGANRLAALDPLNMKWQRDLAVSIHRLGKLSVAQGDLTEALRQFTEFNSIAARLVGSDPSNAEWQRDLAVSVHHLGELSVAQGNLTGALRHFTEFKSIAAHLAESDPSNAEWQRNLAASLGKLGELTVDQGDLTGALRYFSEYKLIAARLAASDPENATWQRDLAVAFGKMGELAAQQGNLVGAMGHLTECYNILIRLTVSDPVNAEWQRELSVSLNRLGELSVARGNLTGALRYFTECNKIIAHLALLDPDNSARQSELSASLRILGELAMARGDLTTALTYLIKCNAIADRLALSDPANAGWQRELSLSLIRLGDLAMTQRDLAGALRYFTKYNAIAARLALSNTANAEWQHELSISLSRLGDIAVAQGDLEGAMRYFSEYNSIITRIVLTNPANVGWQRERSVSLNRLGDMAVARNDVAGALRYFTECNAILARLVSSDPANAMWQNDLIINFERLGQMEWAKGNMAEASNWFIRCRSAWAKLIEQDPANAGWQRGITVPLVRLGELAIAQGDFSGALRAFTESKTIIERLATSDPANAARQRDLWVSYYKLAELSEKWDKKFEAQGWWEKAYDTLAGMKRTGLSLSPQDLKFLVQLEAKVRR